MTCEYDELSENNLLNQILKTTVMLLLCHARVDQAYKSDLKKEMLFFSNVDTIDPAAIRWSAIRFQRNNNTYRMLISLCQLILEGMLLTSDSGEYRLASFIDEQRMNLSLIHISRIIWQERFCRTSRMPPHSSRRTSVQRSLLSKPARKMCIRDRLQSGKPLSEGRGMGLYIVRKLLNSFGGEIELLDERNEYGNRYKFLLVSNTSEEL